MLMISFVIITDNYFFREGLIHFISSLATRESFIPILILDKGMSIASENFILIHDQPFNLLKVLEGLNIISSRVIKEISMHNVMFERKARTRKKDLSMNHKFDRIFAILNYHITKPSCQNKIENVTPHNLKKIQESLNRKHIDLLNCLSEGLSMKQSARKMNVCTKTLYIYKSQIMGNTGCRNNIDITKLLIAADTLTHG